jgi:hypothetical protein
MTVSMLRATGIAWCLRSRLPDAAHRGALDTTNSPLTFGDIKSGTREEVHDVGELWAVTLWDVRNGLDRVGGLGARSLSNSSCPA